MLPILFYTGRKRIDVYLDKEFEGKKIAVHPNDNTATIYSQNVNKAYLINYSALFLISILAVAHKVHYIIPLILVLLYSVIRNRKVLTKVDYSLLATFVALFVFIGNVGRIPFFRSEEHTSELQSPQ